MMEESRKQFEDWIANTTNSDLHRGIMLDRRDSGVYGHLATQNKWDAWQASRAAIEIEFPADKHLVDNYTCGFNEAITVVAGKIRDAGLKIKGE